MSLEKSLLQNIALRSLLYNLTLQIYTVTDWFIYKSKRHAQSVCIFNKKNVFFFLNEDKIII